MGKNVRLDLTENEKLAQSIVGLESDGIRMNMAEDRSIENMIERERASKFNDQVDEYIEKFDKHANVLKEYAESFNDNMNSIEIKPMFARILVKPFEQNPFQKIRKSDSGLIIDTGGLAPQYKNSDTGEWEEEKQFIVTGTVVDCGPDVKYLSQGDVVFYRTDTSVPVPFFRQGLVSLAENQIIAVVNEGLTDRFNKRK